MKIGFFYHVSFHLSGARAKEQSLIQKTSYLSSLGSALAPTVPILSAITSFLTHLGSGYTLSAAQVCSSITFTSMQS